MKKFDLSIILLIWVYNVSICFCKFLIIIPSVLLLTDLYSMIDISGEDGNESEIKEVLNVLLSKIEGLEVKVQKLTNKTEILDEKLDRIINTLCKCNPVGSESQNCDELTEESQCQCRPGYEGKRCSQCQENHYGDPDVQCLPCNCNTEGSFSAQCNIQSGQCYCLPNVKGKYCDTFGKLHFLSIQI